MFAPKHLLSDEENQSRRLSGYIQQVLDEFEGRVRRVVPPEPHAWGRMTNISLSHKEQTPGSQKQRGPAGMSSERVPVTREDSRDQEKWQRVRSHLATRKQYFSFSRDYDGGGGSPRPLARLGERQDSKSSTVDRQAAVAAAQGGGQGDATDTARAFVARIQKVFRENHHLDDIVIEWMKPQRGDTLRQDQFADMLREAQTRDWATQETIFLSGEFPGMSSEERRRRERTVADQIWMLVDADRSGDISWDELEGALLTHAKQVHTVILPVF